MIVLGNRFTDRIIGKSFKNCHILSIEKRDGHLLNVNSIRRPKECSKYKKYGSHIKDLTVGSVHVNKTDRFLVH